MNKMYEEYIEEDHHKFIADNIHIPMQEYIYIFYQDELDTKVQEIDEYFKR